jgi:hypothetical protein
VSHVRRLFGSDADPCEGDSFVTPTEKPKVGLSLMMIFDICSKETEFASTSHLNTRGQSTDIYELGHGQ